MSASNLNNAAAPRQVACETSDGDRVPTDLDVLLLSRLFKKMYDDLGLEEHAEFPGAFPVKTVSSRVFQKVIEWCKEHIDDPEPVIEKDSLNQECKWFNFSDYDKTFFDLPMPELLELVMAANYLDIPRLYHYACQSVAARIKGKQPREICDLLQQDCDLDRARMKEIYGGNPWLAAVVPGARIKDPIFVPNEVLVTIFEKLPREDLERLQLVSTQFDDVIVTSSELSERQGPLRVVTELEFGASQRSDVWLRDGQMVTCADYADVAKRLKCSAVQKMRVRYIGACEDDIEGLTALLPATPAWKNATAEVSTDYFAPTALAEFVFTHLLLCKEIVLGLDGEGQSFTFAGAHMDLPAIVACNKLDLSLLGSHVPLRTACIEWLEHELPPEKTWSEPRQLTLKTYLDDSCLTALKTAFSASSSPKPYIVRIHPLTRIHVDEVLTNEKTHEVLTIRKEEDGDIIVTRA